MDYVFDKKKVYQVKFVKKDGSIREMLFTLNPDVIPETKGNKRNLPENLLTVFDLEANDWRTINLSTLISSEEVEWV